MHLQAWDPYYLSPLWCLNEAKELFTVCNPDFSLPTARFFFHFSLSNILFVFFLQFRVFFEVVSSIPTG